MKTYEVEIKRESWATYTVESDSEKSAIDAAYRMIEKGASPDCVSLSMLSVNEVSEIEGELK